MATPKSAPRKKSFQFGPRCGSEGESLDQEVPITVIDKPTTINAMATGILFSGLFSSWRRIMVSYSFR
jgi:hypothetical protein